MINYTDNIQVLVLLIFVTHSIILSNAARRIPVIQVFDIETVNRKAWTEQVMARKLLNKYKSTVRPAGIGNKTNPVYISASVFLRSISKVSDAHMQFEAQFRFQQEWVDPRLAFGDHLHRTVDVLNLARDQGIWRPDTFFQNERDGRYHNLDQPNFSVKVLANGKIIYNRRLTLTLSCYLDLIRYPMDSQSCVVDFASYAYTTKDIVYIWDVVPLVIHPEAADILPNFFVTSYKNSSCTSKTATGEYSCLRVELELQRVFSFFLLNLYIPSSMLVTVSWVSYWIDWRSTAARVPLAIVTLLTMITQSSAVNANLPPVAYTKALDVWIGGCIVFIFASLLEYAFVNYTGMMAEKDAKAATAKRRRNFDLEKEAHAVRVRRPTSAVASPETETPFSSPRSTERISLLRRRVRDSKRNRRPYYTSEFGEVGTALLDMTRDPRSPHLGIPGPGTSRVRTGSAQGAEEADWALDDVDWIRLSSSRRVEISRLCQSFGTKGRAERIDMISRIFFPCAWLCFNVVYWLLYWSNPVV